MGRTSLLAQTTVMMALLATDAGAGGVNLDGEKGTFGGFVNRLDPQQTESQTRKLRTRKLQTCTKDRDCPDNFTTPPPTTPPSTPGRIALLKSLQTVNESAGQVLIDLVRTEGSVGAATVRWQTAAGAGTATAGQDYVYVEDGSVDFADGQTTAQIEVTLINDALEEGVEKFSVSLFGVLGADLGTPRTIEIAITDDDSTDLVGYWKFDEETGTTASDSSGNGNVGTHLNFAGSFGISTDRPTFDTTTNLRSLKFDGFDDYVSIAGSPSLDLSAGQFTESVWLKPEDASFGYQAVLGFQDGPVAHRYPSIFVYQQTHIHTGFGDGSNWNGVTTGPVLTLNEWNHVATTFDGTSYKVFVNGQQAYTTERYDGITPFSETRINIGYISSHFEGNIDEVRIYKRALTADEIPVLLIDGASLPPNPSPPTIPTPNGRFVVEEVLSGFTNPNGFVQLSDGKMLVSEKRGSVILIQPNGARSGFLNIEDIVNGVHDRGVLGFTIHPNYETDESQRYIYVSYTHDPPEVQGETGDGGPDGHGARVSRISRFTVNSAGTFANRKSEVVLVGKNSVFENIGTPDRKPDLDDPHSCGELGSPVQDCIPADEDSHTIGDLEFGTDGYLYCSTGDGGSYGRVDIVNYRSQELDSLAGKILRIHPETGEGLTDNPFYDGDPTSNRSKVWMLGFRNPYRFTVNPTTGGIYIGDVGWGQWEEINHGPKGSNFGWPCYEGGSGTSLRTRGYDRKKECVDYYSTNPDVTASLWARHTSDGAVAIIMGAFVKGSAVYPAGFDGMLLFTDIGDKIIRVASFEPNDGSLIGVAVVSDPINRFFIDFWLGPDGYMYCANFLGTIERLVWKPQDDPPAPATPAPMVTPAPVTPGGIAVTKFVLVNADTNEEYDDFQFFNSAVINTRIYGTNLNIVAYTTGPVESVVFDRDGFLKIESAPPYAMAGDSKGNYNSHVFSEGIHTVTATPYTDNGGGGTAGPTFNREFTIVN